MSCQFASCLTESSKNNEINIVQLQFLIKHFSHLFQKIILIPYPYVSTLYNKISVTFLYSDRKLLNLYKEKFFP